MQPATLTLTKYLALNPPSLPPNLDLKRKKLKINKTSPRHNRKKYSLSMTILESSCTKKYTLKNKKNKDKKIS